MAEVVFSETTRRFPGADRPAVDRLDLLVRDGEFLVLVGPSGCGKTTSLRMLAGLEGVDEGAIFIGGRDVTDLAPRDRDVAMVFQSYALYPHMSVADNMGFALKVAGVDRNERERRVLQAAQMLDLDQLLERRPRALSGGQRQRVAMGRAIVRQPQAFLMDEPLSNLDAQLRVFTRAEIHRLQRDLGITTVYVTHDQVEAMTMGDRVAVMRDGVLQQVDTPQNVYDHPANRFVAGFIGSPSMNLIEGRLTANGEGTMVDFAQHSLVVGSDVERARPRLTSYIGRTVIVGIRPEDFSDPLLASSNDGDAQIDIRCDLREALGSDVLVHFAVNSTSWVARLTPRSRVTEGETVSLGVDVDRLHFFDPETGVAINGA
ncbi:MAG TPA: sn-glycerol-3-phosphate ABC transporter ATP-binding protein UgpC [Gaiellaceae bacterium]|nr:sn-glycerol-3-phosphate ABC transporter ATP-binding protein UgpC [Gaiellaceae bacterium]